MDPKNMDRAAAIDPSIVFLDLFQRKRPKDPTIEAAVSPNPTAMTPLHVVRETLLPRGRDHRGRAHATRRYM